MSERNDARIATVSAFNNRLCKGMSLADGTPLYPRLRIEYQGDFPYQSVAESVDLPKTPSTSHLPLAGAFNVIHGVHKTAWSKLFHAFDREWNQRRAA